MKGENKMTENKKRGRPPKNTKTNVVKETETKEFPKKKIKEQRNLNELIEVKCIVHGGLYYVTSEGFEVVWPNYGDINYLEYKELMHMAGKAKRFFIEPWIIMEQDILEDLRVAHHYKKMIDYENIDAIFKKSTEELKKVLPSLPDGTKRLIADRATSMIKEGKLDSLKTIEVLQTELKVDLI